MEYLHLLGQSTLFSILGIVLFLVTIFIFDKITPHNLWHEVIKEKNLALALIIGSIMIGISIIIAFAHG